MVTDKELLLMGEREFKDYQAKIIKIRRTKLKITRKKIEVMKKKKRIKKRFHKIYGRIEKTIRGL